VRSFRERLHEAARRNDSWVCVGLDPDLAKLPRVGDPADETRVFLLDVIDRTKDAACCFKPNAAFFEAIGPEGPHVLAEVIAHAERHAPVILDGKRGDIGNTAKAYAAWCFDQMRASAATVPPYMGRDSIEPFAERADKGVFVLARTSNPGAEDLQSLKLDTGELLYERVVKLATGSAWNAHGNLGLVAGATYPHELQRIRQLAGPDTLLLIPGVGAQGGSAEHAIRFGANPHGDNAIVSASRSILYAKDPAAAAMQLRDELNKFRASR
jgi:orotidine 5'-phosphate decarboxylase subfamily 2